MVDAKRAFGVWRATRYNGHDLLNFGDGHSDVTQHHTLSRTASRDRAALDHTHDHPLKTLSRCRILSRCKFLTSVREDIVLTIIPVTPFPTSPSGQRDEKFPTGVS